MVNMAIGNSSFVSIGVTGNYTRSDLFYLQNVMNEWNTKIKTPKLGSLIILIRISS